MKTLIFFLILNCCFNKLTQTEKSYKNKCRKLHQKIKENRKLMATIIKKIIEKAGIHTYTHNFFHEMWGGINNIQMGTENPFVVINRYPENQYFLDEGR